MKFKMMLIAALLPSCVLAQAYSQDPSTGRRFDQYGRPMPSLEELCREGQMAGGPITLQCAQYQFNRKGERLVRYDFTRWGYNLLDLVTTNTATKLDTDPKYRAAYIKAHHIQPYVKHVDADSDVIGNRNGVPITRGELRALCADAPRDPICR